MPVNMGTEESSGGFEGLTGNFLAKPVEVADKLVEGKEDRPDAVRVVFEVKDKEDKLSLFVPLHESAADRLRPFIKDMPDGLPLDEDGMRKFLAANMPGHEFLVYANNSSIRGVTAPPGKQRVRLTGLNQYSYTDDEGRNVIRVRFFTETKDHETVTFTVRYPNLVTKVGDTPEEDDIGPAKEFNPNPYLFNYLCALGLDWARFAQEVGDAYENGRLFSRLGLDGEVPGYFSDPNDITEELFQAAKRHSPNRWAEVMIVDHPKYGLGPKRGDWSRIEFTPIIVEGAGGEASNAEFDHEVGVFLSLWDTLTKLVMGKDDARFIAGKKITQDGIAVARAVIKPLVMAHPQAVTAERDGKPAVHLPPTPDTWTLDGMVVVDFTAERLIKAEVEQKGTLFEIVNLSDDTGEKVLAWAAENVPEWETVGQDGDDLGAVL